MKDSIIYLGALLLLISIDIYITQIFLKKKRVIASMASLTEELLLLDGAIEIFLSNGMSLGDALKVVINAASSKVRKILIECIFSNILNKDKQLELFCNKSLRALMDAISRRYPQVYDDLPVDLTTERLASILTREQKALDLFDEYAGVIVFVMLFLPLVLIEISLIFNKMVFVLVIPLLNAILTPLVYNLQVSRGPNAS